MHATMHRSARFDPRRDQQIAENFINYY